MRKKCSQSGCTAPKGLCKEFTSQEYQTCSYWNQAEHKEVVVEKSSKGIVTTIPWSGLALQPSEIELFSHRSSPKIIGIIGAAEAGKTSYLGMLYTLLFNGKRFNHWDFAGSFTLIAWETLAKYLKVKSNGKVDFPEPTPSNPDFYSLYHLALRNEEQFHDILFADSSGEVFTQWANNIHDDNAENARWIYQNSQAFIFFIDCEAVIEDRGRAKRKIVQLAGQVAAQLNDRPIVVVWSKADKIDEIRPNIKKAIEEVVERLLPNAEIIQISNFSQEDPDSLCHINNLKVTEYLLDRLSNPQPFHLTPDRSETNDFFFKYMGSYGN